MTRRLEFIILTEITRGIYRVCDVNEPTRILRKASLMAFIDSVKLTCFLFQNKHCVFYFSCWLPEIRSPTQLNVPGQFAGILLKTFKKEKGSKCPDNSMQLSVLLENKGETKSIKWIMRNVGTYNCHAKPPC